MSDSAPLPDVPPAPAASPPAGLRSASARSPHPRSAAARVVAALLVSLALATFAGVLDLGFVLDDFHYLHLNGIVGRGLTASGVRAAFTSIAVDNWHPLTWLSHMLDVELFDLEPAGHHAVSLLLHATNAVLVFALLRSLTGALWRPALAAALFALHPLRVESVAWVAERKDVLSAFLGLLCLLAYQRHLRAPGRGRAALVALLFALGLLAKPMLVTLPLVMLLLDWWPLGRTRGGGGLMREKAPLFAMAGFSAVMTLYAQGSGGAVVDLQTLPLTPRLANAASAGAAYLGKVLLPSGLAIPYPHRGSHLPPAEAASAVLLLLAVTAAALLALRRRPWLAAGWLWFLVMLVPVIGLVQVGNQAMADRYTYLPALGVVAALVWLAADLVPRRRRAACGLAAAVLLGSMAALTHRQIPVWRDEIALAEHALRVTGENAFAHTHLAVALAEGGRSGEAEEHYREALRINPGLTQARANLGGLLAARGETDQARYQFLRALAGDPRDAEVHANLGDLLLAQGRIEEGLEHHRDAARLRPRSAAFQARTGAALLAAGRHEEAVAVLRARLRLEPDDPEAHADLAAALSALETPVGSGPDGP